MNKLNATDAVEKTYFTTESDFHYIITAGLKYNV